MQPTLSVSRLPRLLGSFALATTLACQASPQDDDLELQRFAAQADIDVRRSLVVTEQPILARFPLSRVLNQLVAQSGVPGLTALGLFQQWWDTQNPGPAPQCTGVLNDFPYDCRPGASDQEGAEATSDPFVNPGSNPGEYIPIGLFNRFDLAPANGANCGEHRIVYARRSGITAATNRNLFILEATLPNPHLGQGLKGCHKIVKFWADLTRTNNLTKRADDLEKFYFDGIANIPPVVHVAHFGDNPTGVGQIRTNQFMQANAAVTPKVWNLREFKLIRTCTGSSCSAMKLVPVTNKTNPFGPLFTFGGAHAQTAAFQADFVAQVATLAADSLAGINMLTPDSFNTGQSLASGSTENNYVTQFGAGPNAFHDAIADAIDDLTPVPPPLSPVDIVARAQALSCAGCHRLSGNNPLGNPPLGDGLVWPASLGFTHVTETLTEVVGGVTRFLISPALVNDFLPVRKQVLDDFMNDKPPHVNNPHDPIGGRHVH